MNLGMIRTESDHVRLRGACHLPPDVTDGDYEGWMAEVRRACEKAGARMSILEYKSGFRTATTSAFVKEAQTLAEAGGLDGKLVPLPLSGEANVFSRMGIECLVFGAGRATSGIVGINEKVRVDDLRRATEFYRGSLERFCQ